MQETKDDIQLKQVQTETQRSIINSLNLPTDGSLTSLKVSCNWFHVLGANDENAVLPKSDFMRGVSRVIQLLDLMA